MKSRLAENIKTFRKERKMTQEQLAERSKKPKTKDRPPAPHSSEPKKLKRTIYRFTVFRQSENWVKV